MNHLIIHVPHSSSNVPKNYRDQFLIDDNELNFELDKLTDHFTDSMVEWVETNKVISPYSRILEDLERFTEDALEKMFERGMGVIYSNGHALNKIRRALTNDERTELIGLY